MIGKARIDYLTLVIAALLPTSISYSGECFRCVAPKYSTVANITSGDGSKYASGRYHVAGKFKIVYTSLQPDWALAEFCATARSSGFRVSQMLPIVMAAAKLKLSHVLDLTDTNVRKRLRITKKELIASNWATSSTETETQLIGRLAKELGYEALLVPSASGRKNLNILVENLLPASKFEIINPGDLPLNP